MSKESIGLKTGLAILAGAATTAGFQYAGKETQNYVFPSRDAQIAACAYNIGQKATLTADLPAGCEADFFASTPDADGKGREYVIPSQQVFLEDNFTPDWVITKERQDRWLMADLGGATVTILMAGAFAIGSYRRNYNPPITRRP